MAIFLLIDALFLTCFQDLVNLGHFIDGNMLKMSKNNHRNNRYHLHVFLKMSEMYQNFWHFPVDFGLSVRFLVSFAKVSRVQNYGKFSKLFWLAKVRKVRNTGKVKRPKISGKSIALVETHFWKESAEANKSLNNLGTMVRLLDAKPNGESWTTNLTIYRLVSTGV